MKQEKLLILLSIGGQGRTIDLTPNTINNLINVVAEHAWTVLTLMLKIAE
ncbi:MAG: hypothetical protein GY756_04290 [bacterium]|nr:hypothetical protein [bacterium]